MFGASYFHAMQDRFNRIMATIYEAEDHGVNPLSNEELVRYGFVTQEDMDFAIMFYGSYIDKKAA